MPVVEEVGCQRPVSSAWAVGGHAHGIATLPPSSDLDAGVMDMFAVLTAWAGDSP